MRIRFMGLICHVGRQATGNDDLAVLVKAAAHIPMLRVPNRHIFGNPPGAGGTDCRNITNHTVRLSLGSGVGDRGGLQGRVPNLKDFGGAGGTPHPNVRAQNAADASDGLESLVVLPEGSYGIDDWFPMRGTLPEGDVCIARTVTYDAKVPSGTTAITITGIPGQPIAVKPTAIITITNLEPRPWSAVSHFHEYGKIFQPAKSITPPKQTSIVCSDDGEYYYPSCRGEGSMNIGVECTNSTYP